MKNKLKLLLISLISSFILLSGFNFPNMDKLMGGGIKRPTDYSNLLFWGAKGSLRDFNYQTELIRYPDFSSYDFISDIPYSGEIVDQFGTSEPPGRASYNNGNVILKSSYTYNQNIYCYVFREVVNYNIEIVISNINATGTGYGLEVEFEGVVIDTITTVGTHTYNYTGTGGTGMLKLAGKSTSYPNEANFSVSRVSVIENANSLTNHAYKNYLIPSALTVQPVLTSTGTNEYIIENSVNIVYNYGGYTEIRGVFMSNSSVTGSLLGFCNSSDSTPDFEILHVNGQLNVFLRNDQNTILINNIFSNTTGLNDGVIHVFRWIDNNGECELWIDGVRDSASFSYTLSGTLTVDVFSVFALAKGAGINFFEGSVYDVFFSSNSNTESLTTQEALTQYHDNVAFFPIIGINQGSEVVQNMGGLGGDGTLVNFDEGTDWDTEVVRYPWGQLGVRVEGGVEILSSLDDFSNPYWSGTNVSRTTKRVTSTTGSTNSRFFKLSLPVIVGKDYVFSFIPTAVNATGQFSLRTTGANIEIKNFTPSANVKEEITFTASTDIINILVYLNPDGDAGTSNIGDYFEGLLSLQEKKAIYLADISNTGKDVNGNDLTLLPRKGLIDDGITKLRFPTNNAMVLSDGDGTYYTGTSPNVVAVDIDPFDVSANNSTLTWFWDISNRENGYVSNGLVYEEKPTTVNIDKIFNFINDIYLRDGDFDILLDVSGNPILKD